LTPGASSQWRLAKHDGRAEAALIALFGLRQPGAGIAGNGLSEGIAAGGGRYRRDGAARP